MLRTGKTFLLNRVFRGQDQGFYIDVGANDPVVHSKTKHFYARGWRGINVEPHITQYERLVRDRSRDICLNVGLSDRDGVLTYYLERQVIECTDLSRWRPRVLVVEATRPEMTEPSHEEWESLTTSCPRNSPKYGVPRWKKRSAWPAGC